MAAIWAVTIRVLDLAQRRCSITYTRTDDEAGTTWTHTYDGIVDTDDLGATRLALLDRAWADYSADIAAQAAIAEVVPAWEAALTGDIAAREVE